MAVVRTDGIQGANKKAEREFRVVPGTRLDEDTKLKAAYKKLGMANKYNKVVEVLKEELIDEHITVLQADVPQETKQVLASTHAGFELATAPGPCARS